MKLQLTTPMPAIENDLCDVLRLFFGEIELCEKGAVLTVVHSVDEAGHHASVGECRCSVPLPEPSPDALEEKRRYKRAAKSALYGALKAHTGQKPPWGSLTGIRPTRLYYERIQAGDSPVQATRALVSNFDLDLDKAELLGEIYQEQQKLPAPKENEIDVYIGIPFCKTRCSYCSFAAVDLKQGGHMMEAYVEALVTEMRLCADALRPFPVRSLYIGGGTPTALPRQSLARVIDEALRLYPGAVEFTVEAGRPDTIDEDMLRMLKDYGVNRISINPQTMNDETLLRIGRLHSARHIHEAYALARRISFDVINMDMIVGLPGEGVQDVQNTLKAIEQMQPDNLTVHTLAIKRASKIGMDGGLVHTGEAGEMLALTRAYAGQMGLEPYYLYRQKYMAGNLENVGYCKPGLGCLYNIDNMEEIAPIAAFGAGAISKWLYDRQMRIERAPNIKNVELYIARATEMAERKCKLVK